MQYWIRTGLAAGALLASASMASAEPAIGLVGSDTLVTFDTTAPGVITSRRPITGLPAGERLTGLDLRPANNQLYSVSATGNLYLIAPDATGSSFTATSLGSLSTSPMGSSFGIDFNPTVDRLRFVSDTNQNLRINTISPPGTIVDGNITLNGNSAVDLVASAYTNSVAGATSTVLYGLDSITDSLVRATNANLGTYTNTNVAGTLFLPLGAGITFNNEDRVTFDISGTTGQGFFSINDALFSVNLLTGAGAFVGTLGTQGIVGITLGTAVPEPGTWAMMLIGFGCIGFSLRSRARRARRTDVSEPLGVALAR